MGGRGGEERQPRAGVLVRLNDGQPLARRRVHRRSQVQLEQRPHPRTATAGCNQQHTAKLLDKLDSKLAAPFSIYPLMTHLALDIITECACGEAVGALEGGNSEYVTAVYAQLSVTFERLMQAHFTGTAR